MGRWTRAATTALLIAVLCALTVPAADYIGVSVSHSVSAAMADDDASTPTAARPPTNLDSVSGVAETAERGRTKLDRAELDHKLDRALTLPGTGDITGIVTDVATGTELYANHADTARIPASNMKLLTSLAALKTLGSDTRFKTTVVSDDGGASETGRSRELTLVGGGDVLLGRGESAAGRTVSHAGLATLAERTIDHLEESGPVKTVHITVDDTLFTGKDLNPHWAEGDIRSGQIAPIAPMALYAARFEPGSTTGPRPTDPALRVGQVFAAQLAKKAAQKNVHVDVDRTVTRGAAGDDASTVAAVESATVAQQVAYLLTESDNYVAEVMGRMAAHATGRPAGFSGAAATTRAVLTDLGIDTDGLRLADACGLSMGNRVSVRQLAAVVSTLARSDDRNIRAGLAGMPIAGLTGTLEDRYQTGETDDAAGLVRAKTGTLNAVQSLTGTVVNDDGRLLVFSFVANGMTGGSAAAKPVLDRAATILAGT